MGIKQLFLLDAEDYLEKNLIRIDLGRAIIKPPIPAELEQKLSHYTSNNGDRMNYGSWKGLEELREKIAELHSCYRLGGVSADQVIITHGATGARQLYVSFRHKSSRIIIQSPYFFDYLGISNLTINNGILEEELKNQDTFLMSNPHNPLGTSLSQNELNKLGDLTKRHSVELVIDSVYRGFELDYETYLLPNHAWEFVSVGKALGMTDMRIGALIVPKSVISDKETMRNLHYQQNNHVIALSQHEQKRALEKLQYLVEFQSYARSYLKKMSDYFQQRVYQLDGIQHISGGNAGLHFVKYEGTKTSRKVAWDLLKNEGVYIMPGDDFGAPNHLRVCLGASDTDAIDFFASVFRKYIFS